MNSAEENDEQQPTGPSAFITEAYSLDDKDHVIAFYRKWADDYDEQMASQGYRSPAVIADLLCQHLTSNQVDILDAGCGTGLTGQFVYDRGSVYVDGIDISGEMIAVARTRNIYRKLVVGDLNQALPFPGQSYDAIVSSGTFTHGHVGPDPLDEFVRLLRPGGLIACTIHFDLWHRKGFDKALATLIANGQLRCLALQEGPYYDKGDNEGWFCVYQKV